MKRTATAVQTTKESPEAADILEKRFAALRRMEALRERAISEGMQTLSEGEVLELIARRRGEPES